ncbi:Uncharacterised protein [uncultured archaeon]|nr:Uncharacterised protein [uncultured archaeon]
MTWYNEASAHFLAGVSITIGDRLFSRNAARYTEQRVKDKLAEVEALEYIANNSVESNSSEERFCDSVMKARDYFTRNGISSEPKTQSFYARVKDTVESYKEDERINNLSWRGKLTAAFGLEFLGDIGVVASSLLTGKGDGVVAFGETFYQAPSLWAGFQVGRGLVYAKDVITRSRDEKDLDKMAKELTADGKLLEIIRNYSPTAKIEITPEVIEANVCADGTDIKSDSEAKPVNNYGEKIADAVESVGNTFSSAVDALRKRRQSRIQAEKDARDKERADLRSKYDKY